MNDIDKVFKEWFIEFVQENFAQVKTKNAETIWNAGAEYGSKQALEKIQKILYVNVPENHLENDVTKSTILSKIDKEIDTELEKLKDE